VSTDHQQQVDFAIIETSTDMPAATDSTSNTCGGLIHITSDFSSQNSRLVFLATSSLLLTVNILFTILLQILPLLVTLVVCHSWHFQLNFFGYLFPSSLSYCESVYQTAVLRLYCSQKKQ